MELFESLKSNLAAAGQVLVLGCLGFYILKRGILGECCLRTVSNLVIEVSLPCFMFTNIVMNFGAVRGERWYAFPLACLCMFAIAGVAASVVARLDGGSGARREFIAMSMFNNSGFLPIIIAGVLLPPAAAAKVFIYTFLFLLFYNPILFSISDMLFSGRGGWKVDWKSLVNAPNVATILGFIAAATGLGARIPDLVFKPMRMVGDTTIPLSMIVVGGIVMVNYTSGEKFRTGFITRLAALKLVLLPLAVYALLLPFRLSPEVRFFLVLESMMPPGAMLPLLAHRHGGDYRLVGQALFATTLLSIVTVPVLLTLLRLVPAH